MNEIGLFTSTPRSGAAMTDVLGAPTPDTSPWFPQVAPSGKHAVLYHVPKNGRLPEGQMPVPQKGSIVWDHDHVQMPFLTETVDDYRETQHNRWDVIKEALTGKINDSEDLANAILKYNPKFRGVWTFRTLHGFFNIRLPAMISESIFRQDLRGIVNLALDLPNLIKSSIPLLKQGQTRSISLSQLQVASLLANAFFCTFPGRNLTDKRHQSHFKTYPSINFNRLYESQETDSTYEKMECILRYLVNASRNMSYGVVTFSRRSVLSYDFPAWAQRDELIASVPLRVDSDTKIEDVPGLIQVDFANKYIGGGVLGRGSVQEEIRFVVYPEMMVSMLFTEMMDANEAVMIIGCERFNQYRGYSRTFEWKDTANDQTPKDLSGRRRCAVLAIDALQYHHKSDQYEHEKIVRELNKAWAGFSYPNSYQTSLQYPGIATGSWGCGAFNGDKQLKGLIQIMACAVARRPIAYFMYGDPEFRDLLINMYDLLVQRNVSVGQLFNYITTFSERRDVRKEQLFDYIQQSLQDAENHNF